MNERVCPQCRAGAHDHCVCTDCEVCAHRFDHVARGESFAAGAKSVVRVGVAVILRNSLDEVLMGRRKGSHGSGTWSFPGGHLEPGESVFRCASRELLEETGIPSHGSPEFYFKKLTFTNDVFNSEGKHYVTLYVQGIWNTDLPEPRVIEPDKCAGWGWFRTPPSPLFLPIENLLKDGFRIWPP
jgi:8-oxo-dGTP diphosphatase